MCKKHKLFHQNEKVDRVNTRSDLYKFFLSFWCAFGPIRTSFYSFGSCFYLAAWFLCRCFFFFCRVKIYFFWWRQKSACFECYSLFIMKTTNKKSFLNFDYRMKKKCSVEHKKDNRAKKGWRHKWTHIKNRNFTRKQPKINRKNKWTTSWFYIKFRCMPRNVGFEFVTALYS